MHYEGEYFINETTVTLEVIQNNIAYINQEATVSPNLTVKQHFLLIASIYNIDIDEQKMKDFLELVHLNDKKMNDVVDRFSLGEKRRFLICLSLMKKVPIIVMDEPTASLDIANTKTVMELLKKISHNTIIIISSHDKETVPFCDEVFEMKNGSIYQLSNETKENNVISLIQDKISVSCSRINQFKGKKDIISLVVTIIIGILVVNITTLSILSSIASYTATNHIVSNGQRNEIFFSKSEIDRDSLMPYSSYISWGLALDDDELEMIEKNIGNVLIKPMVMFPSTNYGIRIKNEQDNISRCVVKKNGQTFFDKEFDTMKSENTPFVISYDKQQKLQFTQLANEDTGIYIDEDAAFLLGIDENDFKDGQITITLDVGIPIKMSERKDVVGLADEDGNVSEVTDVDKIDDYLYYKDSIKLNIAGLLESENYSTSFIANGGGGLIYAPYECMYNIIQEYASIDLASYVNAYEDLDEKFVSYEPLNYIVFVENISDIDSVNEKLLSLDRNYRTFIEYSYNMEIQQAYQGEIGSIIMMNIAYVVIGMILLSVFLYRYLLSRKKANQFLSYNGLTQDDILSCVRREALIICILISVCNVFLSFVTIFYFNGLILLDRMVMYSSIAAIGVVLSLILYYCYVLISKKMIKETIL